MTRAAKPAVPAAAEPPGRDPLSRAGKETTEIAEPLTRSPSLPRYQLTRTQRQLQQRASAPGYWDFSTECWGEQENVCSLTDAYGREIRAEVLLGTAAGVRVVGSGGPRPRGARSGRVVIRQMTEQERAELDARTTKSGDRDEFRWEASMQALAVRVARGDAPPPGTTRKECLLAAACAGVAVAQPVLRRERAGVIQRLAVGSRRTVFRARSEDLAAGLVGAPADVCAAVKPAGNGSYQVEREYENAVIEAVVAGAAANGRLDVSGPVVELLPGEDTGDALAAPAGGEASRPEPVAVVDEDLVEEALRLLEGRVSRVARDAVVIKVGGDEDPRWVVVRPTRVIFRTAETIETGTGVDRRTEVRLRTWVCRDPSLLKPGDRVRCRGPTVLVQTWGPCGAPRLVILKSLSAVRRKKAA